MYVVVIYTQKVKEILSLDFEPSFQSMEFRISSIFRLFELFESRYDICVFSLMDYL